MKQKIKSFWFTFLAVAVFCFVPRAFAQIEPDGIDEESTSTQGQEGINPDADKAPGNTSPAPENIAPGEEKDINDFYGELSAYGEWLWTGEYGYVWRPFGLWEGWRPYTNGRWMYTSYGWYWHSYFPWGTIPFHYGNWANLNYLGWVWVPGTVWGPAWVMWRYSDEYIGWAPIPPGYDFWFGWGFYPVFYASWIFIDWRHYCDPYPHHYYIPANRTREVFGHTSFPTGCRESAGSTCSRGFNRGYISKKTGVPVQQMKVKNVAGASAAVGNKAALGIKNDVVEIYRPKLKGVPAQIGGSRSMNSRPRVQDLGEIPNQPKVQIPQDSVVQPRQREMRIPTPGRNLSPKPKMLQQPSMPRTGIHRGNRTSDNSAGTVEGNEPEFLAPIQRGGLPLPVDPARPSHFEPYTPSLPTHLNQPMVPSVSHESQPPTRDFSPPSSDPEPSTNDNQRPSYSAPQMQVSPSPSHAAPAVHVTPPARSDSGSEPVHQARPRK
jgi:hypothetical protein